MIQGDGSAIRASWRRRGGEEAVEEVVVVVGSSEGVDVGMVDCRPKGVLLSFVNKLFLLPFVGGDDGCAFPPSPFPPCSCRAIFFKNSFSCDSVVASNSFPPDMYHSSSSTSSISPNGSSSLNFFLPTLPPLPLNSPPSLLNPSSNSPLPLIAMLNASSSSEFFPPSSNPPPPSLPPTSHSHSSFSCHLDFKILLTASGFNPNCSARLFM